jgi:hypothetical protein
MKLSNLFTTTSALLAATTQASHPSTSQHEADIMKTAQTFYRALDIKSESLMRSVTTANLTFDGSAFAPIDVGSNEPLVGQDLVVPGILAILNMTTMHNLANYNVTRVEGGRANVTAYVLAYH